MGAYNYVLSTDVSILAIGRVAKGWGSSLCRAYLSSRSVFRRAYLSTRSVFLWACLAGRSVFAWAWLAGRSVFLWAYLCGRSVFLRLIVARSLSLRPLADLNKVRSFLECKGRSFLEFKGQSFLADGYPARDEPLTTAATETTADEPQTTVDETQTAADEPQAMADEIQTTASVLWCTDCDLRMTNRSMERCEVVRSYGGDSTGEAAVVCGASADFFCEECGWVCEPCARSCTASSHELTEITARGRTTPEIDERYAGDSEVAVLEAAVLESVDGGGRR
jgi:hypothetical protein